MKFIIVSIVIFCVSGISANPFKEESQFTKGAVTFARRAVWMWERLAGFNSEASLESNVKAIVKATVDVRNFPEWNPDISAKDNLEKYIMLLHMEDNHATLTENIKLVIDKLIDIFPVINLFNDSLIEPRLIRTFKELVKERIRLDFNEPLEHGIEDWLASLSDLKVSRPEDIVAPTLKNIFEQLGLSGFSLEKTLQDNVAESVKAVFDRANMC